MQLAPSPVQLHTPVTPSSIVNPKFKSTTKTTKQSSNPSRSSHTRTSSLAQLQAQQKKTLLQQPKKVKKVTVNKEAPLRKTSTPSVSSSDLSNNLNCMSPSEVSVNILGKFMTYQYIIVFLNLFKSVAFYCGEL
jgi:hypothetical protein